MFYSLLAASGLFLGALVGVYLKPSRMVTASIMAFGSGALVSALAFELVEESFQKSGFLPLVLGFVIGGVIFVIGNSVIDRIGGYLRNTSNQKRYIRQQKKKFASHLIGNLSKVDILRLLSPEEINKIVAFIDQLEISKDTFIFKQGDEGDALYLIDQGNVDILSEQESGLVRRIDTLGPGQTFGEMALVTKEKRSASARALADVKLFRIRRTDFDRLIEDSPKLATAVSGLLAQRLTKRTAMQIKQEVELDHWKKQAIESTEEKNILAIEEKVYIKKDISKAASLAIFLGALIDGIPESAVIGANVVDSAIPRIAFLIAVFLSNFPEALSSAAGLIKSGFSRQRVFLLWGGLIILSGITALVSNILLAGAPVWTTALADAIAAGGILAMLSNTMMPEAFELGGATVALATIAGFLCTFLLKIFG
jgi:CRP-like cAMP-binding protein